MKIIFDQDELKFLNDKVTQAMVTAASYRDIDGGALMRLLKKMRYKFTPNAAYVVLTSKERGFLKDLADYGIQNAGLVSDTSVLRNIIKKVAV